MPHSTGELRELWREFECAESAMVVVPFGPDRIRVAPPTAEAWQALATVLDHHGYEIRITDTDSYNCRTITGGSGRSLHSYGIALDVNWTTNPFRDHDGTRLVRFSEGETQAQRAEDVKRNLADTDMLEAMIVDVRAIRTKDGDQVFEWGGDWSTLKDTMHFEIDLSPDELSPGIDWTTVRGHDGSAAGLGSEDTASTGAFTHAVIARDGLRLRAGPGLEFAIIRSLPFGTRVNLISRNGQWGLVDLQSDGRADGHVHLDFLKMIETEALAASSSASDPSSGTAVSSVTAEALGGVLGRVTPEMVQTMFPATSPSNIRANLPHVLAGLQWAGLTDRPMLLMALATIRAETEGFVPIDEGRSKFNTAHTPFDKYEPGTSAGNRVGNTVKGDGPRFKGRGYVQLTGRDNYQRLGPQVGADLVASPERANDPKTAGRILAQFLKNHETRIRTALEGGNLKAARKAVNGGSHGLERFSDAYERGDKILPS